MNEKETSRKPIHFSTYLCILAAALLSVWMYLVIQEPDIPFDSEPIYSISEEWNMTVVELPAGTEDQLLSAYPEGLLEEALAEGTQLKSKLVSLPYNEKLSNQVVVYYSKVLEQQETICNVAMFRSSHQKVRIWLGDQLLSSYGYDQSAPFSLSPGSAWQLVRLPEDWAGQELIIESIGYKENYSGNQNIVYLGTKSSVLYMLIRDVAIALLVDVVMVLCGAGFFLVGCVMHKNQRADRMRWLGLFAMTSSVWIFLEMRVSQFYSGRNLWLLTMIFVVFSLVPILLIRFLFTYECIAESRYMQILYFCSVVVFATIHLLNLFDIVDYHTSIYLVHGVIICAIVGVYGIYINKLIRRQPYEHSIFTSAMVFALFSVGDFQNFFRGDLNQRTGIWSQIGLMCFVLILGLYAFGAVTREWGERQEQLAYKKLAYMDILTGVNNRTAFEEKMEYYRKNGGYIILMVVDINFLKYINDTHGHKVGDAAIIKTVELLKECFEKDADCYRVGGDEFVVISNVLSEEEFAQRLQAFSEGLEAVRILPELPLNVAYGYVVSDGTSIDQAFIKADEAMYRRKGAMKAVRH